LVRNISPLVRHKSSRLIGGQLPQPPGEGFCVQLTLRQKDNAISYIVGFKRYVRAI
jgi:hypothetical protein